MPRPIWTPPPDRSAGSRLAAFARALASGELGPTVPPADLASFEAVHGWSVRERTHFWSALWRFCDLVAEGDVPPAAPGAAAGIGLDRMAAPDPELGPRWFPGARLNFAENLLRRRDDAPAIVAWNEQGRTAALSFAELAAAVARCRAALRAEGVVAGDRVAGYLPNVPEAVVAMLASASLGAVWSSCSPDFGVEGVLDRFRQIGPRVLVVADGYRYAGKEIDGRPRLAAIAAGLPTVTRIVVVPYRRPDEPAPLLPGAARWDAWLAAAPVEPLAFLRLPFDHPLYVMYSSGTTGLPKGMVHGAGGTLLQHMKELALHTDVGPDDRLFYFTTCGWMMWNWLVSGLAVGATIVLYDGAPLAPGATVLWDMAEAERVTVFGTSAKYLALAEKAGLRPVESHDLDALCTILSTGSPLAPHSYDYVYRDVKRDVCLSSISGGTDIISCFALGNPFVPVYRGELQGRGLGMAVEVLDEAGRAVVGQAGELVCTRPFPSMPVAFWNDPDGARYRAAYFEQIPGVWRHGDWAELTERGGLVIHGRSDATLNPGGVRIGTAEIYRVVETLDDVVESLVVGQDLPDGDGGRDVRVVLFVRLREGVVLDESLRERIRRRVREEASPHHVPRLIVAVADIPRTVSGKITELAVREVIHGRPVKNVEALANPQALDQFRDRPELRLPT